MAVGLRSLLCGSRGAMYIAKGSDIRSGVPLVPLGFRSLLRGRRGTMSIAKGTDARPNIPLVPLGLWSLLRGRRRDNVHCQGVESITWLGFRSFLYSRRDIIYALPRAWINVLASL